LGDQGERRQLEGLKLRYMEMATPRQELHAAGRVGRGERNPLLSELGFNYLWSNPAADNHTLCCAALTRPDFDDLVLLQRHLGIEALRDAVAANDRDGWPSRTAEVMGKWYVDIIARASR
jgi:hypothetical protein